MVLCDLKRCTAACSVLQLQMRKPGTSFADKNNVQRLAGDALQGMPHVTTFNLQVGGSCLLYMLAAHLQGRL
jgi:hypothetical protein